MIVRLNPRRNAGCIGLYARRWALVVGGPHREVALRLWSWTGRVRIV